MKIESVSLEFPGASDGQVIFYRVGNPYYGTKKQITEIKRAEKNGEMAKVQYFEIYTEDGLVAELHHYSNVTYFPGNGG